MAKKIFIMDTGTGAPVEVFLPENGPELVRNIRELVRGMMSGYVKADEEFEAMKAKVAAVAPLVISCSITITGSSSGVIGVMEMDEENKAKLLEACKDDNIDKANITFDILNGAVHSITKPYATFKQTTSSSSAFGFGVLIPAGSAMTNYYSCCINVGWNSTTDAVALTGNPLSVNLANLSGYPALPAATKDVAYGLMEGNWEVICPANYQLVMQATASAASLALKSLQNGVLMITESTPPEIVEEIKRILGEDRFNELAANAASTLELTPQPPFEKLLEQAIADYEQRKADALAMAQQVEAQEVADSDVEPSNPQKS